MGFHASKGAQAKAGEFVLQLAHVVPAHREVVDEVVCTFAHRRRYGLEFGGKFSFGRQCCTSQLVDATSSTLQAQGL